MKCIFFYIFLIFSIPVDGKLVLDDDTYINNVTELPYSSGNRMIKWQHGEGNLEAWVDIVGFRNMSRMNGTNYTFNDPASEAIIDYGTHSILDCNYGSCSVDDISTKITVYTNGSNVTAKLNTVINWTMVYCYDRSCQIIHHTEEADFYDHTESPKQFASSSPIIELKKIKYNFSEFNRTYLEINFSKEQYDRYTYITDAGNLTHIYRSWKVKKTGKGVYFANETLIDITQSNNVSHAKNIIEIQNNTNYTVITSGFYSSSKLLNVSHETKELGTVNQMFSPYLISLVLIFFVMYKYCKLILTRRF